MKKTTKQNLVPRPPVVVVMGHIDHGKTKLLDFIRKTNVIEKEAGGITQHIGAYEVDIHTKEAKGRITFLDTPGHEAFSAMRVRGAKVADVAVLVIAADEGVKPQTKEALEVIHQAEIPYVVAINKIDKPNINLEQVKRELGEHGIFIEEYGGKVPAVNISAKTGQGVEELLETILLVAEMEELKADPSVNASGVVIESHLEPKRGIAATLLIQNGVLKSGMFVVSGKAIAPVRIFENFLGDSIKQASFSSPVRVIGFSQLPLVGASFHSFQSRDEAESFAGNIEPEATEQGLPAAPENSHSILSLLLKADMAGSLEAIENEAKKLSTDKLMIKILKSGVGDISEDDVKLAGSAQDAIILGFNVKCDGAVMELAKRLGVQIQIFDVIYKMSEWLKGEIEKRVAPKTEEQILGEVEVLKIFSRKKKRQVVGGRVVAGNAREGKNIQILRRDFVLGKGKILELQRQKIKTSEVSEGQECGMLIESNIEIAEGDKLHIIL